MSDWARNEDRIDAVREMDRNISREAGEKERAEHATEIDALRARIAELEAIDHRKALLEEGFPSAADVERAGAALPPHLVSPKAVRAALIAALTEERT